MDDEAQRDLRQRDLRQPTSHAALSGLLLLSIPASCLISYLLLSDYTWLNAIALLIVPFAFFCWIFTTIRAIHLAGVRFWFIPSTYVTLIGGIIALVISAIMLIFSQESARRGHQVTEMTLYVAAAIPTCPSCYSRTTRWLKHTKYMGHRLRW
jgi:hypothetical protein